MPVQTSKNMQPYIRPHWWDKYCIFFIRKKKVIRLWRTMDIGLSLLLHPAGMGCWAELIPRAKEQGQRERGYRHSNAFLASAHSTLLVLNQPGGFVQRMWHRKTGCDEQETVSKVVACVWRWWQLLEISPPVFMRSPVSHNKVHSCPQPQLPCLHTVSVFISPLLPHHYSGISCSVANSIWFSPSPCFICNS